MTLGRGSDGIRAAQRERERKREAGISGIYSRHRDLTFSPRSAALQRRLQGKGSNAEGCIRATNSKCNGSNRMADVFDDVKIESGDVHTLEKEKKKKTSEKTRKEFCIATRECFQTFRSTGSGRGSGLAARICPPRKSIRLTRAVVPRSAAEGEAAGRHEHTIYVWVFFIFIVTVMVITFCSRLLTYLLFPAGLSVARSLSLAFSFHLKFLLFSSCSRKAEAAAIRMHSRK